MDRETFDTTMRAVKVRSPFVPFTISLENGERLEVDFPDALVFRDGAGVFVGPGGVLSVFDYRGVTRVTGDIANPSDAS